MELPALISDLALILLMAALVTILFKKLKQPLVLGYIVAGFLVSSYCSVMPTVSDPTSIETWSEIGIIIIMFTLGLEFNLHKLAKAGGTAMITAALEVLFLGSIGYLTGQLIGWTSIESLFLGGMLSMSSTMIIAKSFEEMNLRTQKHTDTVLGVLIVEDIAGIFMMIMLTTISVSQNVSGFDLAARMLSMLLYLALWLVCSIYLIPTVLRHTKKFFNDETLLVVALGACFGMVLLADFLGFSSALGAFMAGSIFAGTQLGERAEHVVKPVKDLFGAIFFVSVGMMVQPAMIVEYWLPILVITLIVMVFKPLVTILGMLLSGQSMHTAVLGGVFFAQVGEFSFIIAALGKSLGVIGDFIYPVIVSVSVITIFTTPFFIKSGPKLYGFLDRRLPSKLRKLLERYTSEKRDQQETDQQWHIYLKKYAVKLFLHAAICFALILAFSKLLIPWLLGLELMKPIWMRILALVLLLAICAPIYNAILRPKDQYFINLWTKEKTNRLPLICLVILRILVVMALILLSISMLLAFFTPWALLAAAGLIVLIASSKWLTGSYLQVEARFLSNLNEKQLAESGEGNHAWMDEQLFVSRAVVPENCSAVGRSLAELRWGATYGIQVIKICRGKKQTNIPEGFERIAAGDELYALGEPTQLSNWLRALKTKSLNKEDPSLRQFVNTQENLFAPHDQLLSFALRVEKGMHLSGRSIRDAQLKTKFDCIIIGMDRNMLPIFNPKADMILQSGDILWLLGSEKMGVDLLRQDMLPENREAPQEPNEWIREQ